jgi:hypothetical protein
MIDFLLSNIWILIIPIEILLLFIFYKFYFAEYNAQRWLSKAEETNFLEGLLRPVLDIIVNESTDSIASRMKMELLSAQGVMSKQVLGSIDMENPEDQLLKVSETLLQSIGYRNPSPLITMKLAQGIGTMAGKYMGENGSANTANSESIPIGADLFNQ